MSELNSALQSSFGFRGFRPHQEDVCLAAYRGDDVLLVMPTGAGKSLCYQLPVVAAPGARAIIITPLLALIEDQVDKLHSAKIAAERIHSGRSRQDSQEACRMWRDGELKFLFIAPERLAVPGFLEFLERNPPTMVAVDEAHCISAWGHDFRAEYRMLGPRLARLRPANIIAVTATATAEVQKDICAQLELKNPCTFIHGFRRDNIAIEIMELSPGSRAEACKVLLAAEKRLPAIVYAPTRKLAESTAEVLKTRFRAASFHAGMPPILRQGVQSEFLAGDLDVIVATIAFGMGIDKSNVRTVVHMALPSSLEGYYQEIGRAGRDGLMSEAVMMYAPVDKRTHEYFLENNYPDPLVLQKIFENTPKDGIERDALFAALRMEEPVFVSALEKLWIHGGVRVSEAGLISSGDARWLAKYMTQRRHKRMALDGVLSFATKKRCRMLQLLEHFGDRDDVKGACGLCDMCLGDRKVDRGLSEMTDADRTAQTSVMRSLVPHRGKSASQLYREDFERRGWERNRFEWLVDNLETQGFVSSRMMNFEKDGRDISFKLLELTVAGRTWLHQAKLAPNIKAQMENLPAPKRRGKPKTPKKKASTASSRYM